MACHAMSAEWVWWCMSLSVRVYRFRSSPCWRKISPCQVVSLVSSCTLSSTTTTMYAAKLFTSAIPWNYLVEYICVYTPCILTYSRYIQYYLVLARVFFYYLSCRAHPEAEKDVCSAKICWTDWCYVRWSCSVAGLETKLNFSWLFVAPIWKFGFCCAWYRFN